MTYEQGCPAKSLAGHDKDRYFIILTDEGEYVTISDGKTRTVENPKRKNKKHIQAGKTPLPVGNPATDEAVRTELLNYVRSHCDI